MDTPGRPDTSSELPSLPRAGETTPVAPAPRSNYSSRYDITYDAANAQQRAFASAPMYEPDQGSQQQMSQAPQQSASQTTQYAASYNQLAPQTQQRSSLTIVPASASAVAAATVMSESDMYKYVLIGALIVICLYLLYGLLFSENMRGGGRGSAGYSAAGGRRNNEGNTSTREQRDNAKWQIKNLFNFKRKRRGRKN